MAKPGSLRLLRHGWRRPAREIYLRACARPSFLRLVLRLPQPATRSGCMRRWQYGLVLRWWLTILSDTSQQQIGRAHVITPVTNAQLVCRLQLETTHYVYLNQTTYHTLLHNKS